MSASKILWPDDLFGQVEETPLKILKEQAASLADRSKHRLRATVDTFTHNGKIRHSLVLVVPALDDYRYELLEIEHGPLAYPVTVVSEPTGRPAASKWRHGNEVGELDNEEEFVDWLRNVLQAPETKRIVGSLFSQANA